MRHSAWLTTLTNTRSRVHIQKSKSSHNTTAITTGRRLVLPNVVLTCIMFSHKRWHVGQMRKYLNLCIRVRYNRSRSSWQTMLSVSDERSQLCRVGVRRLKTMLVKRPAAQERHR